MVIGTRIFGFISSLSMILKALSRTFVFPIATPPICALPWASIETFSSRGPALREATRTAIAMIRAIQKLLMPTQIHLLRLLLIVIAIGAGTSAARYEARHLDSLQTLLENTCLPLYRAKT